MSRNTAGGGRSGGRRAVDGAAALRERRGGPHPARPAMPEVRTGDIRFQVVRDRVVAAAIPGVSLSGASSSGRASPRLRNRGCSTGCARPSERDTTARRTEKSYVAWIRRYILFHDKRHPAEMGAPEATRFLTALAVDESVASATQNQALSALLFLYRHVLEQDLPWLDGLVRAKRPERLPVVLTRHEVKAVISRLDGCDGHF